MGGWRATLRALVLAALLPALIAPAWASSSGGRYYLVTRSETLANIARRNAISVNDLAKANRLSPTAKVAPNSRLWIPSARPAAAPPAPKRSVAMAVPARKPATSTSSSASALKAKTARKPTTTAKPAPAPEPESDPAPVKAQPAPRTPAKADGDTYVVRAGDTLWQVAEDLGIPSDDLAAYNDISPRSPLRVGQKLRLNGESMDQVPGGGLQRDARPAPVVDAAPPAPSPNAPRPSAKGYNWPVEGRLIRRFVDKSDEKFTGIDIAARTGTEVRASRAGKVVYASDGIPSYGRMVIVEHDNGMATCYGQLGRILVTENQRVAAGQVLGRSGSNSQGEQLVHFELRRNRTAVDPEPYLP